MKMLWVFTGFFAGVCSLTAQSAGFSEGKSIAELRAAVAAPVLPFLRLKEDESTLELNPPISIVPLQSSIFLPQWTAEELPFFCKIEHRWGKKSRVPLKFRLGSVEYVDRLEGKSID